MCVWLLELDDHGENYVQGAQGGCDCARAELRPKCMLPLMSLQPSRPAANCVEDLLLNYVNDILSSYD